MPAVSCDVTRSILMALRGILHSEFAVGKSPRRIAEAASLQKIWKSHNIPISTKIRLMKALVWPVATYGCESWTLRKNEETRPDGRL